MSKCRAKKGSTQFCVCILIRLDVKELKQFDWRPRKKMFVSGNGPINRVGRLVKISFLIIFLFKNVCFMHVLC